MIAHTSKFKDNESLFSYFLRGKVDHPLEILLDQEKYDFRIRPNYDESHCGFFQSVVFSLFPGGPVVVTVGFYLLSINSINVVDMDFTFDVFLRQQWIDKRLDHGTNQTLYLSNHVNDLIWIPDSYFVNAKNGEMHDVTSSNVMIMLAPGGLVKYNARITIKAYCPMNLQDFPMDVQRCPITIESYGYSDTHITFRWETSSGMDFVPDTLQMHPQYILTDMELSQSFTAYVAANWTGVTATFVFERIYSYFIYHVYAPSVIVVILSWVGFVLPRDTPPARVTLAVTAVLTIVTILTMLNSSIAKVGRNTVVLIVLFGLQVNYVKKIDVYLICCFLFVFASLVEYSIILLVLSQVKKMRKRLDANEKLYSSVEDSPDSDTHSSSLLTHSRKRLRTAMFLIKTRIYTVSFVSALDDYSLYVFPAGFALFNVVYWLDTFKWI
ncbi:gamma-aminobutyric acid receptor subunit beta-4-like [Orbicella faveolata]|uniref:gamma-aminobutyric acid receptor subunit beta-4-like n=1 Tax=Orbicella faveolata TaxID=48498 RepID=UPI0009E4ABE2|nr:gamma-aminobutyric acid receptor subunit beta-4-like [Orbicella faveolata]